MQNKGLFRALAILILLACLYQLSFTWATRHQEKKAEAYAAKAIETEKAKPEFAMVSEDDQAYYLDSVNKVRNRYYLDSIADQKVFLSNTYKEVKEKEIKLGLDLKGGMNVMMQVQLKDLVKALSNNNQSEEFVKALEKATKDEVEKRQDFITLFAQAWKEFSGGKKLSSIFSTYEMKDKIKTESTDDQVIDVIRQEAESAISNSFQVLRSRIDRFGVTAPNIQRLGSSGRILVELPGVKEPERVRKLLQGTASLEFWPTYDYSEISGSLNEADAILRDLIAEENKAEVADTAAAEKAEGSLAEAVKKEIGATDSLANEAALAKTHPLLAILRPSPERKACMAHRPHRLF